MNHSRQGQAVCIYMDECQLGARFVTNSKFFWIAKYCAGDKQSVCKRRNYRDCGGQVPDNLLPNGSFL
ncbi:hypothetical protein Tel_16760 [Candidatus Tenderia electrophaga]|jgi:hypothetical protein|uniref:Uncharacterized protein n=1 Tax=Candidatus Tenderia electrophaga TaxID=1748243 RepID=A0A0S2THP1_9GAMM|nr:hypothetical protein Tel_16760 [Candidatus Tenderia electrophaga]